MNKKIKITCGLLVYGLGAITLFSNNEWHFALLGSAIVASSTVYVLKQSEKGGK